MEGPHKGKVLRPRSNSFAHPTGFQNRTGPGIEQKFHGNADARMFRGERGVQQQFNTFSSNEHGAVSLSDKEMMYASLIFDKPSGKHAEYFSRLRATQAFPLTKGELSRNPKMELTHHPNSPKLTNRGCAPGYTRLKEKKSEKELNEQKDTMSNHPPSLIRSVNIPNHMAHDILHRAQPQHPKDHQKYVTTHKKFNKQTQDKIETSERAGIFRVPPFSERPVQSADATKGTNLFGLHNKLEIPRLNRDGLRDLKEHIGGF